MIGKKQLIFFILTLIWCGVIFMFSSQNSEASSQTSGSVIETVYEFIVPEFSEFTPQQQETHVESLQFFARKAAHFTAYFILGVLAFNSVNSKKKALRFFIPVIFGFLYACSDELHQYFIPGRSCEFRDVCIDTLGAAAGAAAALAVSAIVSKKRTKTKKDLISD